MNGVFDLLKEYTNDFSGLGIFRLVLDIIFLIGVIIILFRLLQRRVKMARVTLIVLGFLLIYLLSIALQLKIVLSILQIILFWSVGIFVIVYDQDIKKGLENFFYSGKSSGTFTDEQEKLELIKVIVESVDYLSNRKIGALITIERQDSLNSFIDKAIEINGLASQELLTSLFFPGTATHDGAVIIRKNKIMCAGAYFPSTEKYDVPKTLGTRHRAAIGISERYDSITIVVSEETGIISIAIAGQLEREVSIDKVYKILESYLAVK